MLFVNDQLSITSVIVHPSLEFLYIEIRLREGSLLIGLFYRPPSAPSSSVDELDNDLASVPPPKLKSALILGDFNVNLHGPRVNENPMYLPLQDLFSKYGFTQVVKEPTRITNTSQSLIDHVYISDLSLLKSCLVSSPLNSSDHNSISIRLNRNPPPKTKFKRTVWHYARADFEAASDDLQSFLPTASDGDETDVNSLWLRWKDCFISTMAKYIPHKIVVVRRSLPWISRDLVALFRKRDFCHSKAKAMNSISLWSSYRKARNRAVDALRSAKRAFFRSLSSKIKTTKQFWPAYNSLFPNRQRIPALLSDGTITTDSIQSKCNLLNM